MRVQRLHGRHYRTGEPIEVVCDQEGRIASVSGLAAGAGAGPLPWIAPALFDLQINGCHGKAFNSDTLTADDVYRIVRACAKHGISGLLPTLITGPYDATCHGLATIEMACRMDEVAQAVAGIHLEGPYISPEDGPRGAHPRQFVRRPDRDEFLEYQEESGGRIRLVTLAPEVEGAIPFIEWLTGQGIVVAIGHTAASPAQIRDAVRAGARLSTHLGNGSHALLPRHENYFIEQLACDELWASVISDGHHLPLPLLRCIVRAKTPGRVIITCDASSLAGLPPGRYPMWGQELEVQPGGKVIVPGTSFLAGSGVFTDACVRTLLRLGEVGLAEAIDMAGARPRQLLGLPRVALEEGSPADLIVFDHDEGTPGQEFVLRQTLIAGEPVR